MKAIVFSFLVLTLREWGLCPHTHLRGCFAGLSDLDGPAKRILRLC